MLWEDFYDRYLGWAESTVKTRISSLEDIGSGAEVVEACLNIGDSTIEAQLLRKAMRLGVRFSFEDIKNLEGELSDAVFEEVAGYAGVPLEESNLEEEIRIVEKMVDRRLSQMQSPKKKSASVKKAAGLGALSGLLSGLFGSGKKKQTRRCNGDCAHCPHHYGYRHGRWYYGHGHNYGCERGGNKGGGSPRRSK